MLLYATAEWSQLRVMRGRLWIRLQLLLMSNQLLAGVLYRQRGMSQG